MYAQVYNFSMQYTYYTYIRPVFVLSLSASAWLFSCFRLLRMQTVCDYVVATTIIKWDGTTVVLTRAEDPEGFALKIAHFGLLGVTVGE